MKLAALVLIASVASLQAQEISHTTPPKVIHQAEPEYTQEALRAKLEGVVVVSALAGVDGILSEIRVVRGLDKGLDEKAVECVRQWRFKPGTSHGEPVPAKVTIEVTFRLPPSPGTK